MTRKEITLEEWDQYNWVQVSYTKPEYVRGIKKTSPPDDGYKYVDVTTFADKEQKWSRAIEVTR